MPIFHCGIKPRKELSEALFSYASGPHYLNRSMASYNLITKISVSGKWPYENCIMGTIAQVFEQSRRDSLTIISDLKYGFYHARNTCQHFLSEHFLDKNNCSKGYFARYTSSEKRTLTFFINRVSFV